jgi:hypothetical protein
MAVAVGRCFLLFISIDLLLLFHRECSLKQFRGFGLRDVVPDRHYSDEAPQIGRDVFAKNVETFFETSVETSLKGGID